MPIFATVEPPGTALDTLDPVLGLDSGRLSGEDPGEMRLSFGPSTLQP